MKLTLKIEVAGKTFEAEVDGGPGDGCRCQTPHPEEFGCPAGHALWFLAEQITSYAVPRPPLARLAELIDEEEDKS